MLTQDRLKYLFDYDQDSGQLTWRVRRQKIVVGAIAGSINSNGYRHLNIDGMKYLAHRVIWLYVHGAWPDMQIDHINRIRSDNRICNLRLATTSQNNVNKPYKSRSGVRGARSRGGKWSAEIRVNGRMKSLGRFSTLDAASDAFNDASKSVWGEFSSS